MNEQHKPFEQRLSPEQFPEKPGNFTKWKTKMEEMGANTGAVRRVMQNETPDAAYEDFLVSARYADRFGMSVNQVFAQPELFEKAQAWDKLNERDIDAEAQQAAERRALELSQAARKLVNLTQSARDNKSPEGKTTEIHPSGFDASSSQVPAEHIERLDETFRIPGKDINGNGEPR